MAQKRMFSLQVVDTDQFLDMPSTSQLLYFHLGMRGDDDGFVASPRRVARLAGCNDDDMRILIAKGFIIPFESGVIVLSHWNINNTLKNDRYHETIYREEKALLTEDDAGRYILGTDLEPKQGQLGKGMEPEPNVTQPNLTKQREKSAKRFTPPTGDELKAYIDEHNYTYVDVDVFLSYYETVDWHVGKNKMRDWRAAVRCWNKREQKKVPKPKNTNVSAWSD